MVGLVPLQDILNDGTRRRIPQIILAAIHYCLHIVFVRGGGELDRVDHIKNGLVVVIHLGKYFPDRPGYMSGGIRYSLMDNGRLMDRLLVSGFPVLYNRLLHEVKPLLDFVNEYRCSIQIVNHIGAGNDLRFLRRMLLEIITTRNDQRPISPEFEQIMQFRNDFDTDLYVRYSFGDIDSQTYRYAYVWFNLVRYRDPLSQILFHENDVASLYNLALTTLRRKYKHIPTILGLRGQLPSLLISDLMEPLLPGIWHNLHNYRRPSSVGRYIQQYNIDIGRLEIVEVLRLAAGMTLEVTICLLIEIGRRKYNFLFNGRNFPFGNNFVNPMANQPAVALPAALPVNQPAAALPAPIVNPPAPALPVLPVANQLAPANQPALALPAPPNQLPPVLPAPVLLAPPLVNQPAPVQPQPQNQSNNQSANVPQNQ